MSEERMGRGSEFNPYQGLSDRGLKKVWLKQSPCKGCINLDSDSLMGGSFSYCSIVTDMDKFNQSFFGKDFEKFPIVSLKDRVFRNCAFKKHEE